ncbi:hypothetical protein HYV10_03175 [Candidatus Dependentiae bacterium]|nr:hypothetical protein [Candidatus Dependentiae bacterium]
MKKILIMLLIIFRSYTFSIDPNLMYGLGAINGVSIVDNPVIGLSFLKLGIIQSWLESSLNNAVVKLANNLFKLKNNSIESIKVVYLSPEHIGHLLQIIRNNENNIGQLQQSVRNYLELLQGFKDDSMLPKLIADGLQYINTSTVYPQGAVQAIMLGYLCDISQTREEIQAYYQGLLNDFSFKLPSSSIVPIVDTKSDLKSPSSNVVPVVDKKSKKNEIAVVNNYFCCIPDTRELQSFIKSFAQSGRAYDALQNLVLLFFNYKNGNLVPKVETNSLINYLSVTHLGTMMKIIKEESDPEILTKKLGDYLVGLRILNRATGKFLDDQDFKPLLENLSQSVILTQGKAGKYSHDFFENILRGCICTRFVTQKDIENYSKGLFVHATPDLIFQEEQQFACCVRKKYPQEVSSNEQEKKSSSIASSDFDHEHDEIEDQISDAIVERTLELDLSNSQSENSVEAIIFKLVEIKERQENLVQNDQGLSSNLSQAVSFAPGSFYSIKKRQERQRSLQNQMIRFANIREKLTNLEGVSYQRLEVKTDSGVYPIAYATKFFETIINDGPEDDEDKFKDEAVENQVSMQEPHSDKDQESAQGIKSIPQALSKKSGDAGGSKKDSANNSSAAKARTKNLVEIPISLQSPTLMPYASFVTTKGTELVSGIDRNPLDFDSNDIKSKGINAEINRDNEVVIPYSLNISCSGMQPTMGNLALGLQKALNLSIIPREEIHLLIDPGVAAEYFNKICSEFNWNFDSSGFDLRKPFVLKIGEQRIVISLNMQRDLSVPQLEQEYKGIPLPSASLTVSRENTVVPLEFSRLPTFPSDLLKNFLYYRPSESIAMSLIGSGLADSRDLGYSKNIPWVMSSVNTHGSLSRKSALQEIVIQSYKLVESRLEQIMGGTQGLKGYYLQNFFESTNDTLRAGITSKDIERYFEFAPEENINLVLSEINQLTEKQRISLLNNLSKDSLNFLFNRASLENLLSLFNDMNQNQKNEILRKIPGNGLRRFIGKLSDEQRYDLFKDFNNDQMTQLGISDVRLVKPERLPIVSLYDDRYLMQHPNLEEISRRSLQFYNMGGFSNTRPIDQNTLKENELPTSRHLFLSPNYSLLSPLIHRRSVGVRDVHKYVVAHSAEAVREVLRAGTHGIK